MMRLTLPARPLDNQRFSSGPIVLDTSTPIDMLRVLLDLHIQGKWPLSSTPEAVQENESALAGDGDTVVTIWRIPCKGVFEIATRNIHDAPTTTFSYLGPWQ